MPNDKETVTLKLPSGETVDVIVPSGLDDSQVKALLRQKRPELFGPTQELPDTMAQAREMSLRALSPATQQEAAQIGFQKMSGTGKPISPQAHELFKTESIGNLIENAPTAAAMATSFGTGGLPLLARAGLTALAAGGTKALAGGTPRESIETGATLGAAPEFGGAMIGAGARPLARLASRSLGRALGLTEKAVQFGKEPAEEVLRQGIKGGSLPTLVENITQASRETTTQLDQALSKATGTVDALGPAYEVAGNIPNSSVAGRFLKTVEEAANKLGIAQKLDTLTLTEANALKQEVARSAKFVEGDLRPVVSNAGKQYGGKLKDAIVGVSPEAEALYRSSANLTEAAKAGQLMLRKAKVGQAPGKVDIHRPATYGRFATDTVPGIRGVFELAEALADKLGVSTALRIAFRVAFPEETE